MQTLRTITRNILDFIFPQSQAARHIETITLDILLTKCIAPQGAPGLSDTSTEYLLPYADPLIKACLTHLKYHNNHHIAQVFGELLAAFSIDLLGDLLLFEEAPDLLLIPIPLSKQRFSERGYNQVERVARAWCHASPETLLELAPQLLVRTRHTQSQTHTLNRKERIKNVAGCFQVPTPEVLLGRTIILLDDITTTGATLHEARTTLLNAGAGHIIPLAVAH